MARLSGRGVDALRLTASVLRDANDDFSLTPGQLQFRRSRYADSNQHTCIYPGKL